MHGVNCRRLWVPAKGFLHRSPLFLKLYQGGTLPAAPPVPAPVGLPCGRLKDRCGRSGMVIGACEWCKECHVDSGLLCPTYGDHRVPVVQAIRVPYIDELLDLPDEGPLALHQASPSAVSKVCGVANVVVVRAPVDAPPDVGVGVVPMVTPPTVMTDEGPLALHQASPSGGTQVCGVANDVVVGAPVDATFDAGGSTGGGGAPAPFPRPPRAKPLVRGATSAQMEAIMRNPNNQVVVLCIREPPGVLSVEKGTKGYTPNPKWAHLFDPPDPSHPCKAPPFEIDLRADATPSTLPHLV
jgi:hypothetical protein